MQDSSTYQIHVGAVGWTPANARGFYPDDLPAEWRLAYYNNFFSCVYLPSVVWTGQQDTTLAQWRDDTLPRFRFVLQLQGEKPSAVEAEKLRQFGTQVGLLVERDATPRNLLWLEDFPSVEAALEQAGSLAGVGRQVFLISRNANFPLMERAVELLEIKQL